MNKDFLKKGIFILLVGIIFIIGSSYGSSLLFMKFHNLPIEQASVFTIWDYWQLYYDAPQKKLKLSVNALAFGPYVLTILVPLIILFNKDKKALHGNARFATMQEVRNAGLIDPPKGTNQTILVGKFKGKYLTYGGYQFVMLAAPTRSGKGVGVVIPNCLNYSDSLVVLDIKLENFDITAGFRAKHGQEVYLFSPFDVNGRTHRYNPLEYISSDPSERIGDIDAIANALYGGGDDKDKFWSENAKDLFRGLCLMVLEHPDLPKTLGEILRQASGKGKPFTKHITSMINEAKDEDRPFSSACCDALNRIINNSENTLAGIVSTFNAPLLIFQNPRVDLATSANDFDLRDVRRKKMTIYLGVTPDKLKDAAVLVNLFFDQLLNLNTRTLPSQDPSLKYQCLLILDEFTAIGKVAMIQQAISYQAGYNMRVLTIIQNKSQLEDKYGKSGAVTLMANHALMIMYAPSPVVQSDANEYSEMLGYETVKSTSKSKSFSGVGGNGSRSESISDQKRALMLPQELKELGQWREIISLENCKPILCDKIKYFEDPTFTSRINWEVPDIPLQNVSLHIAKIESRIRDIDQDDSENIDVNSIVGYENINKVDFSQAQTEEEKAEKIVEAAGNILNAISPTNSDKLNELLQSLKNNDTLEQQIDTTTNDKSITDKLFNSIDTDEDEDDGLNIKDNDDQNEQITIETENNSDFNDVLNELNQVTSNTIIHNEQTSSKDNGEFDDVLAALNSFSNTDSKSDTNYSSNSTFKAGFESGNATSISIKE